MQLQTAHCVTNHPHAAASPQSPIGARRRLGAELRRLRTKVGLTLDDVADRMTCSTSKISRLETGKGVPKVPDVSELLRIYGVTSDVERDLLLRLVHDGREHGWWETYTEGVQPERYILDSPGRYASLESDARAVRSFDLTIVHGLLQTEDYSHALMRSLLSHHSATRSRGCSRCATTGRRRCGGRCRPHSRSPPCSTRLYCSGHSVSPA